MAIRINVTAVRDCPPTEIRPVMSEVIKLACAEGECAPVGEQLDIHEHGGWAWFTTSVWGVGADDLNRGLCKLARPALQFSTSDGDRWYLTVHGGPRGQVHFLHEFSEHNGVSDPADDDARQAELEQQDELPEVDPELAFLEEERPTGPDTPRVPFDLIADNLAGMGAPVPDAFRAAVAHLPYSAAAARYREWHAEQVSEALAAAGIPHDPAAVRAVLLWQGMAENESGDLGNLPRLLSVVGLGGEWDEYVRQAEARPPEPEPEPEEREEVTSEVAAIQEDPFAPVLAIIGALGLTPVAGGPFALPLADLTLVQYFVDALSIHSTAGVVLDVTLPAGYDRTTVPMPDGDGGDTVELTAGGFRAGMDNHLWLRRKDLKNQLGKRLWNFLYHLPDGSAIDLAFAHAEMPALNQRYRGRVEDGEWLLGETYPPLTHGALVGGIKVARHAIRDKEKHKLRDEAEAEAIVEVAGRDPQLWDMNVQREGRVVWSESDICGHLVKAIYRHRFVAHWDVAAHDREAGRQMQKLLDMQRNMRKAGAEAARRRAAPHRDEVLLRGKLGPYWRADFLQLTGLEQETRERTDAALAGLGFRQVGDLVAKAQRDIVLRAYVAGDGRCYAVLMAKRTMYLGTEFFSCFVDGSTLVTTTSGSESSQARLKVYYKQHAGLEPAALYEKHLWGIERFRTRKGTEAVPLEPSLLGVAREYDRAMARLKGVAQQIRIVSPPPGDPPAKIRAAWVGCVLPLFAPTDDERVGPRSVGVVSQMAVDHGAGFAVRAPDALAALERHNPEAAKWWRDNVPQLLLPGKLLVFAEKACEPVEDTGAVR